MPPLSEKQLKYLESKHSVETVNKIKEYEPKAGQTKFCRQVLDNCTYQYLLSMERKEFKDYQRNYGREYYRKVLRKADKPLRSYTKKEDKLKGIIIEDKKIIVSFD